MKEGYVAKLKLLLSEYIVDSTSFKVTSETSLRELVLDVEKKI